MRDSEHKEPQIIAGPGTEWVIVMTPQSQRVNKNVLSYKNFSSLQPPPQPTKWASDKPKTFMT